MEKNAINNKWRVWLLLANVWFILAANNDNNLLWAPVFLCLLTAFLELKNKRS